MPPPCYVYVKFHFNYSAAFAFFLGAAFFAFGLGATSDSVFTAAEAVVLFDLRFLEFPYEPFQILPFFDFLSPLPIVGLSWGNNTKGFALYKLGTIILAE